MEKQTETRKVEGVVLDDHNEVLWDPEQTAQQEAFKKKQPNKWLFAFLKRPLLVKIVLVFVLLPILVVGAALSLVFIVISIFFGRPLRFSRGTSVWASHK